MSKQSPNVLWFETLSRGDVALVGGKNSSLGEMVQQLGKKGIKVPGGFATTADAYRAFLTANALPDRIAATIRRWQDHKLSLHEAGTQIRAMILDGNWPSDIESDILQAYRELSSRAKTTDLPVAVRSSATAEDLPDASFAGQQETFLNVRGEKAVLAACRRCYASLFTDRAITTVRSRASTMPRSRFRSACSAWCGQIPAARA